MIIANEDCFLAHLIATLYTVQFDYILVQETFKCCCQINDRCSIPVIDIVDFSEIESLRGMRGRGGVPQFLREEDPGTRSPSHLYQQWCLAFV